MRTFTHPSGLWQRLCVADLTIDGAERLAAMADGPVAVVYSDPPWSPGNEKWWRRYASMAPPVDYRHLLDGWVDAVVRLSPSRVFCEQSVIEEHSRMMLEAMQRHPGWRLPFLEQWVTYYGSRSPARPQGWPNVIMHFGQGALSVDPSGMSGTKMTQLVLGSLDLPRGSVIADPCMGKGMTSRVGHACGLCVIGTELNPRRLEQTISWLLKKGYQEQ